MFRLNNNNLLKVYNNISSGSGSGSIIISGSISSSGSICNSGFNNFRFIISTTTTLNKTTNPSNNTTTNPSNNTTTNPSNNTTTNSSSDTTTNSSSDTTTNSSEIYVPKFKFFGKRETQGAKLREYCQDILKKKQIIEEEDINIFIQQYPNKTTQIRRSAHLYSNKYFKTSYLYNPDNLIGNLTNYINIKENSKVFPTEQQRALVLDFLQQKFNSQDLDNFYHINYKEFISNPERQSLFYYYRGSMIRIAYGAFPEHPWIFNMFKSSPVGKVYDNNYEQQIKLFAKRYNIRTAEDWYKVSMRDLRKFIRYPVNSGLCYLPIFVKSHFPELKIKAFLMDSFNFFSLKRANENGELDLHLQDFIDYVNKRMGFEYVEQYYLLSIYQLKRLKGESFLHYFGSKIELYKALYPGFEWDPSYMKMKKQTDNKTKLIEYLFNLDDN